MINFNKEYFSDNYYFFIKDRGSKISLYYSYADTLTESRKKDKRADFDKKDAKKIKDIVDKVVNSKQKPPFKEVEKNIKSVNKKGEVSELVDDDGSMLGSNIPILNLTLTPKKTMDQTVIATRQTNNPVTRGYRVYYGESEEKEDDVLSEVDFSDAFGYEETEDMDFNNSVKTLKKMGVENPVERTNQFGKLKGVKPKRDRKGRLVLRQRLAEKETLEERQKKEMVKMVEDILTKKSKDSSDVLEKDTTISKILEKNLQSIKKIADKEGISINKLINILKKGE
jgi:hypothetical protein